MQLTVRKVETTLFCISVLVLVALIRNLLETQLDQESGNNHFLRFHCINLSDPRIRSTTQDRHGHMELGTGQWVPIEPAKN